MRRSCGRTLSLSAGEGAAEARGDDASIFAGVSVHRYTDARLRKSPFPMSQSSLAFTFCTSSPSTLRAGFARFIAELADLPDASPTLTFHLDDADALSAYTKLLEAIAPEGAVSLHVPHLRTLGPLSSILGRWTEVKCVHLSLDATDGSPFSFGTRFVAPLQPEAKFPLPVMPGVELLIVSIPDRTVEMVRGPYQGARRKTAWFANIVGLRYVRRTLGLFWRM